MPTISSRPADHLDGGTVRLRRVRARDAEAIARAVGESLEHLSPWMAWAKPSAAKVGSQMEWTTRAEILWDAATDYVYVILADRDTVVGTCGLHRRSGVGAIEIGYWVHADHVGRGYATAAARALTAAALALPDVTTVEIHCDQANAASQAIPRRLGYRLKAIEDGPITAPGEVGKHMVWSFDEVPARA